MESYRKEYKEDDDIVIGEENKRSHRVIREAL